MKIGTVLLATLLLSGEAVAQTSPTVAVDGLTIYLTKNSENQLFETETRWVSVGCSEDKESAISEASRTMDALLEIMEIHPELVLKVGDAYRVHQEYTGALEWNRLRVYRVEGQYTRLYDGLPITCRAITALKNSVGS